MDLLRRSISELNNGNRVCMCVRNIQSLFVSAESDALGANALLDRAAQADINVFD